MFRAGSKVRSLLRKKYKGKIVLIQSEIEKFTQIVDMMYVKLKAHSPKQVFRLLV